MSTFGGPDMPGEDDLAEALMAAASVRAQLIDLLVERYGVENDGTVDDETFAAIQHDECERLADDILALVLSPR